MIPWPMGGSEVVVASRGGVSPGHSHGDGECRYPRVEIDFFEKVHGS